MVIVEDLGDEHNSNQSIHYVYNQEGVAKLPVVILTGYLGAGKTTLLNYILTEQTDKRLAVIENEVGEVSIDDALVKEKVHDTEQEIVVLDNGCVCCSIRGDLVKALAAIAHKYLAGMALDGVLIELTGLADPAPVVQTFFMTEEASNWFFVDNVIALVDAQNAIDKIEESQKDREGKGTACAQIAFSSTVLLNKVDLATEERIIETEHRIKEINSTVNIIRCHRAQVAVSKLFNVGVFNLGRILEEQYMDADEFTAFYRPQMDLSVSNVGIRCEGAVSLPAFQEFLDSYLDQEETAKDFIRVKAILNIAGSSSKFVVQAVHMIRTTGFAEPWEADQARENRIIFIGRGMQGRRQMLTEGFAACIAKPLRFEVGQEVLVKTGGCGHPHHQHDHGHDHGHDHCHDHGDGSNHEVWEVGFVVAHWDTCQAYKIRLLTAPLEDDRFVIVPLDEDRFVKPPTVDSTE